MGYDITLHPISAHQIHHFVIAPFNNQKLIDSRIAELTKDEENIEFLKEMYTEVFENSNASQHVNCVELCNLSACVSSFLYPYWYSRNVCLSFLIHEDICQNVFEPISTCTEDPKLVRRFRHNRLLIEENFMSSGFAPAKAISELSDNLISSIEKQAKELKNKKLHFQKDRRTLSSYIKIIFNSGKEISTPFDAPLNNLDDLLSNDTLSGITNTLAFCKKHGLGLIEATDLVIPILNSHACNPENFNASFLEKASQ